MARDIKEGRLSGFVGHGTTLTGETQFHAMLRVDGHLIGTVTSESGTLIIGTNGQVDANIAVAAAMINGTVNGDIVASEKLQLGRTARVLGNIHSPRLIVEEGAILEGSCSMLKARETQEEEAVAAAVQYEQPARRFFRWLRATTTLMRTSPMTTMTTISKNQPTQHRSNILQLPLLEGGEGPKAGPAFFWDMLL